MSSRGDGTVTQRLAGCALQRAWRILPAAAFLTLCLPNWGEAGSGSASQSDWSCGPLSGATESEWGCSFAAADGVSWLAVPGQLALATQPFATADEHAIDSDFAQPAGLTATDLDEDSDVDVIGAAIGGDAVAWWENLDGDGQSWARHPIDSSFAGAVTVRAGDLDGDGDLDVVGGAWTGDEIAWWRNDGGARLWTDFTIATGVDSIHWVDVADLDHDGDNDIVAAVAGLHTVAWWRNDGGDPVAWTLQAIDESFAGARSAVPVDLDGDGRLDLVGAALVGSEVSWWRNLGGDPVAWSKQVVSASFAMAHHVVPSDVDGDGDIDLAGTAYQLSRLGLWRNQGGEPIEWTREVAGAMAGALVLDVRDLDGDGLPDLVASSDTEDAISWWRNDGGSPREWPEQAVAEGFEGAWPLVVADVDGNGNLDVIGGASETSLVAWWRIGDFIVTGLLTGSPITVDSDVLTIECELDAHLPPGTSVLVEFRTAADVEQLGAWREVACGRPVPVMRRRPVVLQYRLRLATEEPTLSPLVRALRFDWSSELTAEPPRRPGDRLRP